MQEDPKHLEFFLPCRCCCCGCLFSLIVVDAWSIGLSAGLYLERTPLIIFILWCAAPQSAFPLHTHPPGHTRSGMRDQSGPFHCHRTDQEVNHCTRQLLVHVSRQCGIPRRSIPRGIKKCVCWFAPRGWPDPNTVFLQFDDPGRPLRIGHGAAARGLHRRPYPQTLAAVQLDLQGLSPTARRAYGTCGPRHVPEVVHGGFPRPQHGRA